MLNMPWFSIFLTRSRRNSSARCHHSLSVVPLRVLLVLKKSGVRLRLLRIEVSMLDRLNKLNRGNNNLPSLRGRGVGTIVCSDNISPILKTEGSLPWSNHHLEKAIEINCSISISIQNLKWNFFFSFLFIENVFYLNVTYSMRFISGGREHLGSEVSLELIPISYLELPLLLLLVYYIKEFLQTWVEN